MAGCCSNTAGSDSVCSAPITLVGIWEIKILDGVKIYPNPTGGRLFIDADFKFANAEMTVSNIVGQTIGHYNFDSAAEKFIDLSEQPNGIYFVKIKTEKGTATAKIILSR